MFPAELDIPPGGYILLRIWDMQIVPLPGKSFAASKYWKGRYADFRT